MSVTFRAMGTDVTLVAPTLGADDEHQLAARVAALFEASERRFSRFRPDSELSRLNEIGQLRAASTAFLHVLTRARRHARRTGGLVTPLVGAALIAAGYDRSFDPSRADWYAAPRASGPLPPVETVVIDRRRGRVTLPPGVSLDFGGLVKGWTVDRAARLLPAVAALDAGGDARLRGAGPDGRGWIVDVEDPADPAREVLTLRVSDRAVATSAPNRRRWRTATGEQHHLIDPRTGRPAASDLAQVTVLADTVEEAEVLAKAAYLLGHQDGRRFLARQPGVAAVLVRADGRLDLVGRLEVDRAA